MILTYSLTHRCVSPHSCTSNAACKEGELCKHYSVLLLLLKHYNTGSSDTCQPKVVGAGSEEWDECGTNVDCEKKNVGKPVCKETMRGRLCVTERECISIFSTLFFLQYFQYSGSASQSAQLTRSATRGTNVDLPQVAARTMIVFRMKVAKGTALMVGNIATPLLQKTHKTPINVVQAQTARSCLKRRPSVKMSTASESAFAQNNVFHLALVAKSAMVRRDVYLPDLASPHWIATLVKNARLTF